MTKVALISCVSMKHDREMAASDLYMSPLFRYSKLLAKEVADKYYILSAKHGLLKPDQPIGPYDLTLKNMSREHRRNWADNVFKDLIQMTNSGDELIFLAGESYREFIVEKLSERGNPMAFPLFKYSIGEQLQWYSGYERNKNILNDLNRFYILLKKLREGLGGEVLLSQADGKRNWPEKGVYFFFESNEFRKTSPFERRVTRIGTHAISKGSKSTLWTRLRTHRGGTNLGGNHRGSIFRLHVGKSIIQSEGLQLPTWGEGQTASKRVKELESELENKVSEWIGGTSILWLNIDDASSSRSDRAFIERNSIGLVSTAERQLDTASKGWLGLHNPHDAIRKSSLWNVNHVDEDYDPRFLDVFEQYVEITLGEISHDGTSIVPEDWLDNRITKGGQLRLFEND